MIHLVKLISAARVYIGLGSNLNDPITQIKTALAALNEIPETCSVQYSSLYRSAPLTLEGATASQPDYINAVAALDTQLAPLQLLAELQALEQRHGRTRDAEHWGPRTLDLDLLLYADRQWQSKVLTVPHPRLHERSFVLYPLFEIAPDINVPGQGNVRELVARCRIHDVLSCSPLLTS